MAGTKTTFAADTSRRTPGQWAAALAVLLTGLVIAHLGVALFLRSALGTDTFTVLIQGLARTVGLSVGTVHVIALCLLMAVMLLTTKGYVKPGTVVCAFCGGPIIDFFTWALEHYVNEASPMALRVGSMALGCVILSLKLPRLQFRWVRVGCDLVFVALGFLLGGTVGVGTLAAALVIGPLVQFWLPRSGRIIKRLLREDGAAEAGT